MDRQQPHRYMPPPPPSTADPYHHQLLQPVPQPGPWYPGQFQYQPPSQQHSPPPPPPHHQQWAPPPPYPAPPYHSYPLHDQYQPHPPHSSPFARPYHTNSQIPPLYPQEWGNANWGHHQGCEYPVHQNEDDWAAKARAWAAAKATTDYQHSQSQIYHDQYPQTSDPRYPDVLQPSISVSSHQQYPTSAAPSRRPHMAHSQESASISSVQSSFVPDEHLAYSVRDGNLGGDSNAVFSSQEISPTSSSFHLQEVPSSYSSVTGVKEAGDQSEQFYRSFPLSVDSNQAPHHVHPPLHAIGRSVLLEQPHYAVGNQLTEASIDPSDQPLVFVHSFNHNHDPRTEPSYIHTDSVAATSSHTWIIPSVPGTVFPPIPSILPSGQQHDSPIPSSVPGHSATLFGRMPGPSFQPPPVPSVGTPFGIGAGSGHHPTTAFPADVYGVPSNPERPKKASVPNWLREEIIKNKAVITSSSEHPKEETESIEDEAVDKLLGKADQGDSKSIGSSKSSEEEDDDEDDVEEARMAAINQEIKRILTEVLLKVTDELFDEIATKVLSEDDLTVEVDQIVVGPEPKLSPSVSAFPTSKAVAEVILENEDGNRKSTSIFPGDVLGLGSYASDDEDDDKNTVHRQPSTRKLLEDKHAVENGRSEGETEGYDKDQRKEEGGTRKLAPNGVTIQKVNELSDNRTGRGSSDVSIGSRYTFKTVAGTEEEDMFPSDKRPAISDASGTNHISGEKAMITELPLENMNAKKLVTDDFRGEETRNKQERNDMRGETKRSSYGKDILKEVDSDKGRIDEREDDRHRRQDGRHMRREKEREKTDDRNDPKKKMKELGDNSREKTKEPDSRKRSIHPGIKEDRKEKERDRRANAEDNGDRQRELKKDEMGERSRQRLASESSRHKRRHSSSVGSRGRSSKDNSVVSHANDSSEESSDDSKRKLLSKRRDLSPSPNRSRRRRRRSRSRSPAHRQS